MDTLVGRTAVVTGAGSGIGRAMARSLAEAGANVAVVDIEQGAAEAVAAEVAALGVESMAVAVDVADSDAVVALADDVFDRFGDVHVLCNNAGVLILGPELDMIVEDWRWILSVNVLGVANGVHAFVPRMLERGAPGHIVNTSSVSAFRGNGPYGASKAAVLSMSETLHDELVPRGIGVSVVCPGNINSRILGAQRNRDASFGRLAAEPFGTDFTDFGIDASHVGRRAVEAILGDELYVFVFPDGWQDDFRPMVADRFEAILAAIDRGAVPGTTG